MEVSGQLHVPTAFSKERAHIFAVKEAGWFPELGLARWWREKAPSPIGNGTQDPSSVIISTKIPRFNYIQSRVFLFFLLNP